MQFHNCRRNRSRFLGTFLNHLNIQTVLHNDFGNVMHESLDRVTLSRRERKWTSKNYLSRDYVVPLNILTCLVDMTNKVLFTMISVRTQRIFTTTKPRRRSCDATQRYMQKSMFKVYLIYFFCLKKIFKHAIQPCYQKSLYYDNFFPVGHHCLISHRLSLFYFLNRKPQQCFTVFLLNVWRSGIAIKCILFSKGKT